MRFVLDHEKYAKLARMTAAEGCVLLRNEKNALPIRSGEKVSVFGRTQFTYYKSGTGSGGMVNAPYVTNILDGLKACGVSVNEALERVYREWIADNPFDQGAGWAQEPWCQKEMPVDRELAQKAAEASDLAVVVIGRTAGEDHDNSESEGSYLLTRQEEALLENVCGAFSRVAVVLNVGNIIDMKWVERYCPQSVLYVWQGGQEGGMAAAEVLTGRVNPSGRLADTIARDISDYPSTRNFGNGSQNIFAEDIYVGYRYFETFAKDKVLYPFGFGLSYTEFSRRVTYTAASGTEIGLRVLVKNTGAAPGKDVVQVYVEAPQGKLGKAARSLAAFQKTQLLAPGEAEELTFEICLKDCASYDDGGVTGQKSCYVLEAGEYHFYVGGDVRSAGLACTADITELTVTERCTEALAPVTGFDRLCPMRNGDGSFREGYVPAPLRTADLSARIRQGREELIRENAAKGGGEKPGDRGLRLADVCDGKASMEQFLSQLSDEELACMIRGEGMCSPKVTPGTAAAFGGVTKALQNYGIPIACCSDGPSGIRMDCGTMAYSLPNGTLLACTFNTALAEELYEMEGMELRKNRIDTLLGPGMNIHRNPLNGRNFEYFSEDPYLTGKMAAAQLRGMAKYGVTGTVKHFACNNQEYRRHDADSVLSERAAREIYLKGFEIAVREGKAYSVMSTYGPLNGVWTAGNYDLLTTILRREWGYEGMVMTDWWAKMNEEGQEAAGNNTVPMVRAQNDVYMVVSDAEKNSAGDNTLEGLETGRICRAELIRNAGNICRFLMRSPVMNRFLDRESDVCEERNSPVREALEGLVLEHKRIGECARLDVSRLDTSRGSRAVYALEAERPGAYSLTLRMGSAAGELAQMPVSVFLGGTLLGTVTITGTGGKTVERRVELFIKEEKEQYLTLFFGESGIRMESLTLNRKEG